MDDFWKYNNLSRFKLGGLNVFGRGQQRGSIVGQSCRAVLLCSCNGWEVVVREDIVHLGRETGVLYKEGYVWLNMCGLIGCRLRHLIYSEVEGGWVSLVDDLHEAGAHPLLAG